MKVRNRNENASVYPVCILSHKNGGGVRLSIYAVYIIYKSISDYLLHFYHRQSIRVMTSHTRGE